MGITRTNKKSGVRSKIEQTFCFFSNASQTTKKKSPRARAMHR